MKADTKHDSLLEQQLALGAYLDALLTGIEIPAAPLVEVLQKPKAATAAEVQTPLAPEPCADGIPEWAQTCFQALLFEVAGLTLAVPLAKLKGVVPNEHGLTEMPGHSSLFLGVTPYQGVQSKVVDTARFVLPKDRAAQLGEDSADRAAHLVVIDEGRWSLACSKIGDVIELEAGQVKWRTAAGKRRWLAGTVIEQMCALLDIDELTRQLVNGMA
jgi:purine-binding chemotaxis protein CheW